MSKEFNRGFLVGAILLSLAAPAKAADFNCARATAPAEVTICRTQYLSEDDDSMARIFYYVRGFLAGGARQNFNTAQRAWIFMRNECQWDETCIYHAYAMRARQLCAYVKDTHADCAMWTSEEGD